MAGKFMRTKKIVLNVLVIALLTSQLSGCAVLNSRELMEMINDGETIEIEINTLDEDEAEVKNVQESKENLVMIDNGTVNYREASDQELEDLEQNLYKTMRVTDRKVIDLKDDTVTLGLLNAMGKDKEANRLGMKAIKNLINL